MGSGTWSSWRGAEPRWASCRCATSPAGSPDPEPDAPTDAYKGGPGTSTSDELTFLAYYTANGNKKFCNARPANAKDKQWAQLYISLDTQAAAKNVRGITG